MTQPTFNPPPPTYTAPTPPQTVQVSGFAVASLVLGIMGWLYAIPAILAVVFGHIAYSKIKRSNGWRTGRGMAIAGFVLGYVWLALFAVLLIVALANSGNTNTTTYDKQPTYNTHAGSSDPLVPFGPGTGKSLHFPLPPMF